MSAGFGFSAGDFIAGIRLISELIKALEESAGAAAEYRQLIGELYGLQRALIAIKELDIDLDERQDLSHLALKQAVQQCQQCIDRFLQKISRYQATLGSGASSFKCDLRKIQWTLCRKDDVKAFRTQLQSHASTINMLQITLQTCQASLQARKQDARHREVLDQQSVLTSIESGVIQNTELLQGLTEQQAQIFRAMAESVQQLQATLRLQRQMPPQVALQQPVILLDACGRRAPFHLEFITSPEAFLAVLKVRFKHAGQSKIERGEFALEEARRKRQIDLSRPWEACFMPGQTVEMSMIFERSDIPEKICPGCGVGSQANEEANGECPHCGLYFTRQVSPAPTTAADFQAVVRQTDQILITKRSAYFGLPSRTALDHDEINDFRRVRIITCARAPEWDEDDEHLIIDCSCSLKHDDGNTVLCLRCDTWQHIACEYPNGPVSTQHKCISCISLA